jgi:hypothetical protein
LDWPTTPEEVVKAYWEARAAKRFDEMAILWPGTAPFMSLLKDEKVVEHVFGKAERSAGGQNVVVPFATREEFEQTGKYRLNMYLTKDRSAKGRYYIAAGN